MCHNLLVEQSESSDKIAALEARVTELTALVSRLTERVLALESGSSQRVSSIREGVAARSAAAIDAVVTPDNIQIVQGVIDAVAGMLDDAGKAQIMHSFTRWKEGNPADKPTILTRNLISFLFDRSNPGGFFSRLPLIQPLLDIVGYKVIVPMVSGPFRATEQRIVDSVDKPAFRGMVVWVRSPGIMSDGYAIEKAEVVIGR